LENSNGLIDIKDATIYTAFKRMEKDALISTYWGDEYEGARRKYYSITAEGKAYYLQKVREWQEINVILDNLIQGRGAKST
jgi:DNA-binding PadR family transcriptional regulator